MSWVAKRDIYEKLAREIDPSIRIVTKDAWPWRVLAALVTLCTFGGISYQAFLREYATTIGPIQGYPRGWIELSERLLVHEARHTQQARWFGLGLHPWLGLPLFGLLYLLTPLPLGFAYVRWKFEIDADRVMYRWMLRHGYSADYVRSRARSFGQTVCSGYYGWSWILKGVSGFERAAEAAIKEYLDDQA